MKKIEMNKLQAEALKDHRLFLQKEKAWDWEIRDKKIKEIKLDDFFGLVGKTSFRTDVFFHHFDNKEMATCVFYFQKNGKDIQGVILSSKAPRHLFRLLLPIDDERLDSINLMGEDDPYFYGRKLTRISELRISGKEWEEDIDVCFPHKLVISIYDKRKESDFPLFTTEVKYSRYSNLSKFIKFDEGAACDERVEEYGKLSSSAQAEG